MPHCEFVFISQCSKSNPTHSAEQFAAKGCITYASARKVEKMNSLSSNIHRLTLDVLSDDSVNAAVETIIREQGRIDILVNNAGLSRIGSLRRLSSTFDAVSSTIIVAV